MITPKYYKVPIFFSGEDKLLQCQIVDSTNTPINLNTYSDIVVWIYSKTDNTVLVKFSKNALADHDNTHFSITNAANGQFEVTILATVSTAAVEDLYFMEVKTKTLATSFKTIYKDYICQYLDALTENTIN